MAQLTCANCREPGHELVACHFPSADYGSITGCPNCNENGHTLDNCPEIAAMDTSTDLYLRKMETLVWSPRANRPQIRSAKHLVFDLLKRGRHKFSAEKLAKLYYWPWSNDFAQKILESKPGDAILQGKKHPMEFVHGVHTAADLPTDPLFKGKTLKRVLAMLDSGQFEGERFVSLRDRRQGQAIPQVMMRASPLQQDLFNKGSAKRRSEIAFDGTLVKPDEAGDAAMLVSCEGPQQTNPFPQVHEARLHNLREARNSPQMMQRSVHNPEPRVLSEANRTPIRGQRL